MSGIFISYRRGDSIGHTGRLYDLLSKHFGNAQVFMDIDAIGPGEDFVQVIDKTCRSCDVLLAVIGRSWVSIADQNGNRRLDDANDFVRMEIARALELSVRVVPVLVDGAQMPDPAALPPDLKKLALRNAWEVNDKRFHHDVRQLVEALQKMQPTLQPLDASPEIGTARSMPAATPSSKERQNQQSVAIPRKGIYAGVGALVILLALSIAYFGWFRSSPASAPSSTPATASTTAPALAPETATTPATAPAQALAPPTGLTATPEPTPTRPPVQRQTAQSRETSDIPSLQARVTAPLLFFLYQPGSQMAPPGQRPYATVFPSELTSGKQIFWEISLYFEGPFPPPNYQIESVWYRDSQEVFRGVGNFRGSEVSTRAFHNRFAWTRPEGRLPAGKYRVELSVAGKAVTSGDFEVQP